MKYLLDTDTCIEYLRGKNPGVVGRVDECGPSEVCLCSIVIAELRFGVFRSSNLERNSALLDVFIGEFVSLAFDDRAAEHYALVRHELTARGKLIGPNDLLIAAIALAANLTVVTHNVAEFQRVSGLAVEDWTN